MARFFTGLFGKSKPTQAPAIALRVNSSVQGTPIPILLGGRVRCGGTLIDYYGFASQQQSSSSQGGGKGGGITGGGGKGQASGFTYTVTFVFAVCEGPVAVGSFEALWINGSPQGFLGPSEDAFFGDYSQLTWGYTQAVMPANQLAYRGVAYVGFSNYALGSSSSLPTINFEILSTNSGFVPGQPDGDPSAALSNFLTNVYWGVGFPPARLGALSGTPSSWQSYCQALGFGVSPIIASPVTAASFANDLVDATNSAACWQDGLLTVVPYGDQAVQQGQVSLITENHAVPSGGAIAVGNAGTFVADGGVSYHGGGIFTMVSYPPTVAGTYSVNATSGVYFFSINPLSSDVGASVDITYSYAAAASYVPDTVPLYDFTVDDFLPNQGTIGSGSAGTGKAPLVVVRKPRDQVINNVKVEYLDRNNSYNPVDIEFKDSASIVTFGRERPSDVKQRHFFCLASAAVQSAALELAREQKVRTFQFTVGRHFVLILELMKVATVSMPQMGLARQPVRITEIQENGDGTLTVTAEEFPGTAAAPVYGTEAAAGYGPNYNQDPGGVNVPLVFEPTDELGNALVSGGGLMIAGAISGANAPIWGGAIIWASYDDQTYAQVGRVDGPARMGVLTEPLPSVAASPTGQTIDQTNVLSVDLTESAGTLASGTQLDATSLNTRCFLGPLLGQPGAGSGEVASFETATLVATYKYDLAWLVRGAYGTESEITTWPAGSGFARLDQGIFTFPYDQSRIGAVVYLKFQSFNIWQGGAEDLAQLSPYAYTITGVALASPLPDVENLTSKIVDGRLNLTWDEISDFRNGIRYEIRQGDTFAGALSLGTVAHPPFVVPGNGTYWVTGWCQPAAALIVRSETASSIVVAGATITQNVVATFDCRAAGWPGTFTGGAGVDSGLDAVRTGGAGNILTDYVVINLSTSVATSVGGDVITFASLPAALANLTASPSVVWSVSNVTNPSSIPAGTLLDSSTSTAVTLTAAVAAPGVGSGDTILFTPADILSLGGEQSGTYTPAFVVDVGRVTNATITISLRGTGVPVGQNILAAVDVLSMPDVLGSASAAFVDVHASLLISQSGVGNILSEGNVLTDPNILDYGIPFAAAQKYSPGDYVGRVFAFVFDLATVDPATIAYLLEATISVQMPARVDNLLTNGTLSAVGVLFQFTPNGSSTPAAFNGGPNDSIVPAITATWGDEQVGDTLFIDPAQLTLKQAFIQIKNGGIGVQRNQVTLYAEGY